MNYYAHGGLANVAQNIATKGRNGDTQLIHVSPKELYGLQALANANGTSLTTNPDTGLPEAFNFKKLIPMIAGGALAATGVGAPMAALMVGGAYTAGTGSLKEGLMAGIGAYGGAGLGAGIASAGASAAGEAGAAAATEQLATQGAENVVASQVANTGAAAGLPNAAASNIDPAILEGMSVKDVAASNIIDATPNLPMGAATGIQSTIPQVGADAAVQTAGRIGATANMTTPSAMSSGIGSLGSQEGISSVYNAMPTGTLPALGATALDASQKQASNAPGYQEDEYDRRLKGYKLSPNYQPYQAPTPNPYYRPTYAAEGGVMESFDDEAGTDMARGGIASLGGYSDGGRMLKGPGDGMSDSIPGVIGGKQPARLADGEFVVPADVVSHLGNGSTDAGAKKLYGMMDKIRQARTGKKKQAPQINVDKYLPMNKKASGGITGYADGGIVGYAEGGTTNKDIVKKIYQEQLGRDADLDPEGLKFWSDALASGQSVANITKGINQSLEGQNFDTQFITSLYRQNLKRNPEQEGYQFWLSAAQQAGYTPAEIEAQIVASAKAKEQVDRGIVGQKFTDMQLNALESDPFGGRYATESIYDLIPNAVNVSTVGDRQAQFVSPVAQQNVINKLGGGAYTGVDVLNDLQVKAAIDVARANGTLNQTGYDALVADLGAAKTSEQTRAALARPQGQVVIDVLRGQQIGEDVNLAAAKTEGVGRQAVLSAQDPGYYQNNRVLTDAYQKAGLTVPFDYNAYKGVDTRNSQANVVTPQNFQNQQNQLLNTLNRNDPYRTSYQPINRGIANMPPSVQDPYSDAGLQFLYENMMNQYAPPPADFVNPGTFVSNRPYTYRPPPPNNLTLQTPIPDAATAAANATAKAEVAARNAQNALPSGVTGE